MPNEKNLQRLNKLLEAFDNGAVQPEELIKAIDAVMSVIDSNSKTLADKMVEHKVGTDGDINALRADLKEARDNLKAIIADVKNGSQTSLLDVKASLLNEIARVEKNIPILPPETDLSEVFEHIEEMRNGMNSMSQLILGENIRNALEALQGDDRLDKSAIRGLDEALLEIKKSGSPTIAGVRLLKYLADVNVEGITDGQTIVWDTTTSKFIPGSAGSGGTFLDLTDTPVTYTGQAGKTVTVKGDETGLEFTTPAGGGDMLAATYDPQNIAGDAFDTDNHTDGTTNHVFTALDDTKLTNIEALADVTDAGNVGAVNAAAASKATPVNADSFPIVNSESANAIGRVTFTNLKAFLKTYFDSLYQAVGTYLTGSGTAGYVPFYDSANVLTSDAHFNYDAVNDILHVHKIAGDATDGLIIESANGTDVGILGAGNTANVTWYGAHNFDTATQDTIAAFTGAGKTLGSLALATYPSLTELSYVKGVTSALQTQLNAKVDNGAVTGGDLTMATARVLGRTTAGTGAIEELSNVDTFVTDASDTAKGKVELAIASEVNTGTDATRAVTPDALAGSYAGTKSLSIMVTDGTTNVATGDGKAYITIPESLNGMNLIRAQATVVTAGTTNATTVMIHNKTDAADMLSGAISIASAGTVGTVGTINTSTDDVATNDILRIDVDSVSTTPPQGLMVILEFRLP